MVIKRGCIHMLRVEDDVGRRARWAPSRGMIRLVPSDGAREPRTSGIRRVMLTARHTWVGGRKIHVRAWPQFEDDASAHVRADREVGVR